MPTSNQAAPIGTSDLGWGVADVVACHPLTGEPTTVRVTCKGCLVGHDYAIAEGGVVSAFPHGAGCPVYRRIRAHTVHELDRRA